MNPLGKTESNEAETWKVIICEEFIELKFAFAFLSPGWIRCHSFSFSRVIISRYERACTSNPKPVCFLIAFDQTEEEKREHRTPVSSRCCSSTWNLNMWLCETHHTNEDDERDRERVRFVTLKAEVLFGISCETSRRDRKIMSEFEEKWKHYTPCSSACSVVLLVLCVWFNVTAER